MHACWAALDLGDTPTTLDLRHAPGSTVTERQRIYARTFAGLRARGLADPELADRGADRPVRQLAEQLRLLTGATAEWDLWLSDGLVALGAVRGERGVVVVQRDHGFALLAMSGPRVPATLVELVGPLNPGRARAVNIPADALDRARQTATDGNLWTLADHLVGLGVDRNDASSLARMCTGIHASGQLGGLVRRDGTEHPSEWVVGFHRAAHGDYLQLRRPSQHGGPSTVTVAPVTAERLLEQARRLVPAA
jgi:hypothetical protein